MEDAAARGDVHTAWAPHPSSVSLQWIHSDCNNGGRNRRKGLTTDTLVGHRPKRPTATPRFVRLILPLAIFVGSFPDTFRWKRGHIQVVAQIRAIGAMLFNIIYIVSSRFNNWFRGVLMRCMGDFTGVNRALAFG